MSKLLIYDGTIIDDDHLFTLESICLIFGEHDPLHKWKIFKGYLRGIAMTLY